MDEPSCDVCVVGGNYAGSLISWILAKQGLAVVQLHAGTHPRFAIGESTTPVANIVLRHLAARHGLPELAALSRYGTAKDIPGVTVGPKRGFSYFYHHEGREFFPGENHANELLVTANSDLHHADTHWHRASVDQWFWDRAGSAGVVQHQNVWLFPVPSPSKLPTAQDKSWTLRGIHDDRSDDREFRCTARVLIDAGGQAPLFQAMTDQTERMKTVTTATYAHLRGVRRWADVMDQLGHDRGDHPFPCDQSAMHHVTADGWLWVLRLDDDLTSVGLVRQGTSTDANPTPLADDGLPLDWQPTLDAHPSLRRLLAGAEIVAPAGGPQRIGRVQRQWSLPDVPRTAFAPGAYLSVDPLHSTGIAASLVWVARTTDLFARHWNDRDFAVRLDRRGVWKRTSSDTVDSVVSLAYRTMEHFGRFTASAMLYFALATSYERLLLRSLAGPQNEPPDFLDLSDIRRYGHELYEAPTAYIDWDPDGLTTGYPAAVEKAVAPLDHVGLFRPDVPNMHRHTAAE